MIFHRSLFVAIAVAFAFSAAAAAEVVEPSKPMEVDLTPIQEEEQIDVEIYDPLESLNRTIFAFNKFVDKIAIKPAAVTYRELVPDWGKDRIHSGIMNMYEPVRIGNSVLQMNQDMLAVSFGRLLTNTILGFGGLIDVASEAGIKPIETDLGLTFKHYGIGKGAYLILPILGPSTSRDVVGKAGDYFMDPFNSRLFHKDFRIVRTGVLGLEKRYTLLEVTDHLEDTSLDEYSATRSMYLQKR